MDRDKGFGINRKVKRKKFKGIKKHFIILLLLIISSSQLIANPPLLLLFFLGLFISKYQRPTEVIPHLRSKPFWNISEIDVDTARILQELGNNWEAVLSEGLDLKENIVKWQEDKNLSSNGTWKFLQIINGRTQQSF